MIIYYDEFMKIVSRHKPGERIRIDGSLNLLGCTSLIALPDNLVVGGWLDLTGCTSLTALPDNLTVNGSLNLRGIKITDTSRVKRLRNGDYVEGRYLYADNILTHVKRKRVVDGYTLYIGKIPGHNVVSDGTYYAHCDKFREGIEDIAFKYKKERGAEQYKDITLDTPLTVEEAKTMYRVITGACRNGTEVFVRSLGKLKATYTPREIIDLTEGQYNAKRFAEFFAA